MKIQKCLVILRNNDPRVYSYAKTIRNLRLDELPQLLNIMFGEYAFGWSACRMDKVSR